jgi:hypothetical protein
LDQRATRQYHALERAIGGRGLKRTINAILGAIPANAASNTTRTLTSVFDLQRYFRFQALRPLDSWTDPGQKQHRVFDAIGAEARCIRFEQFALSPAASIPLPKA